MTVAERHSVPEGTFDERVRSEAERGEAERGLATRDELRTALPVLRPPCATVYCPSPCLPLHAPAHLG